MFMAPRMTPAASIGQRPGSDDRVDQVLGVFFTRRE
jgi:hypothetical protein